MQVVNHNQPIKSLEVSTDSGKTWTATTRKDYNFWENPSGFRVETTQVRVTATTGKSIVITNVGTAAGAKYSASSNF